MPPLGYREYEKAPEIIPEVAKLQYRIASRINGLMFTARDPYTIGTLDIMFKSRTEGKLVKTPTVYYELDELPDDQRMSAWLQQPLYVPGSTHGQYISELCTQLVSIHEGRYIDAAPTNSRLTTDGRYSVVIPGFDFLNQTGKLNLLKDVEATIQLISKAVYDQPQPES